jgi:hypothetical protein
MAAKSTKKTTSKNLKTSKSVRSARPVAARSASAKSVSTKTSKDVKTARSSRSKVVATSPTEDTNTVVSQQPEREHRALRIKKSYFVTALGIIIFAGLVYLLRNLIVAATVNGQPISRLAVVSELEKQGGKQALDSLITKTLIVQEARRKNVVVSQTDIDAEMKKINDNLAKQGQKLDQVLQLQGMTRDQLVEQIKLQKMIEKMVGNTTVTDKDVADYIASNKDSLPQDQDAKAQAANIKTQLQQQKLNEKAQKFLEDLRAKAKINRFVSY